jgi:histone H3/H4
MFLHNKKASSKMSERKTKKVRKQKSEKTSKKPRVGHSHLQLGTVHRIMKASTNFNVSSKAAEAIKSHVEGILLELGSACHNVLEVARKKTVSRDVLISVIRNDKSFSCMKGMTEIAEGTLAKRANDKTRTEVSIARSVRCFGKGIPLKVEGGSFNISEDAKFIVAHIAEFLIKKCTRKAAKYTEAAKKGTISSRHAELSIQH